MSGEGAEIDEVGLQTWQEEGGSHTEETTRLSTQSVGRKRKAKEEGALPESRNRCGNDKDLIGELGRLGAWPPQSLYFTSD